MSQFVEKSLAVGGGGPGVGPEAEVDGPPVVGDAGGFQEVRHDGRLRLVVGFLSLTTLIEGMADVLVVVVAIQLLDLGGAGVGWLNGSWGLGGLIGGAVALSLLRRGRLATGLALGQLPSGAAFAADLVANHG